VCLDGLIRMLGVHSVVHADSLVARRNLRMLVGEVALSLCVDGSALYEEPLLEWLVEWEQLQKLAVEVFGQMMNRVESVEVLVMRKLDWAEGRECQQVDTQTLCLPLLVSLERLRH
jgi:hypothetical protein